MDNEGPKIRGGLARPHPALAPSRIAVVVAGHAMGHGGIEGRAFDVRRRPGTGHHDLGAGPARRTRHDGHVFRGGRPSREASRDPARRPCPGSHHRRAHHESRAWVAHRCGDLRGLGQGVASRWSAQFRSAKFRTVSPAAWKDDTGAVFGLAPPCPNRHVDRPQRRLRRPRFVRCCEGPAAVEAPYPTRQHRGVSRQRQVCGDPSPCVASVSDVAEGNRVVKHAP